jgi:methyltransferase
VILSIVLLSLVTLQRIAEVLIAGRNTRRLLARGGYEVGAGHYPFLVALHALWLLGLWVFGWDRHVSTFWLWVFAALQVLRAWVLATLRDRWTTRIILVPGEPLVRRGPYRIMAHPNYAVVVGEILVLPLAFGLLWFGLIVSALNAAVLYVRVRIESRGLAAISWDEM